MSDKDVTRNVRASGADGIATAKQKHFHSLSEKGNLPFGKGSGGQGSKKDELLARMRERERERTTPTDQAEAPVGGEAGTSGEAAPREDS